LAAERLVARLPRCGGVGGAPDGRGISPATLVSVISARTSIWCPHLRHFMRTVLPATFSSAIWYFALQFSQRNFTWCALVWQRWRLVEESLLR
jgi:hypothetical protein